MKKFLTLAFILTSCFCFAQETPKVDIANPPGKKGRRYHSSATDSIRVDISGNKKGDQSNGAADKFYDFSRIATSGLIVNAFGSAIMVVGFAMKPESIKKADSQRTVIVIGGTLNLIGVFVQALAYSEIDRAGTRLFNHSHTSILINENGIGLRWKI